MLRSFGLVVALFAVGCSGGGEGGPASAKEATPTSTLVCEAGKTEGCPCVDGTTGAQTCDTDGGGWAACKCASDRAVPKQYKPESVCTLDTSEVATTEGIVRSACGAWPVRIFRACVIPDDGVLVGCKTSGPETWCCF